MNGFYCKSNFVVDVPSSVSVKRIVDLLKNCHWTQLKLWSAVGGGGGSYSNDNLVVWFLISKCWQDMQI